VQVESVPGVVLDTNVVLDWLVFADPSVQTLVGDITGAHLRWWTTPAMRCEFASVVGRLILHRTNLEGERLLTEFDRWSVEPPVPSPAGELPPLRCADPDDQPFIDLALAAGARWLLTRDKALLALARPAQARGLVIATPRDWALAAGR
jgi:predicted nucleic acid-binding protein